MGMQLQAKRKQLNGAKPFTTSLNADPPEKTHSDGVYHRGSFCCVRSVS
jgi:hypothetical protein